MELHMDYNIALAVPAYLHGYAMLSEATLLESPRVPNGRINHNIILIGYSDEVSWFSAG